MNVTIVFNNTNVTIVVNNGLDQVTIVVNNNMNFTILRPPTASPLSTNQQSAAPVRVSIPVATRLGSDATIRAAAVRADVVPEAVVEAFPEAVVEASSTHRTNQS